MGGRRLPDTLEMCERILLSSAAMGDISCFVLTRWSGGGRAGWVVKGLKAALGWWRQVRAQMRNHCQGRRGIGGGENIETWKGAEVFQVAARRIIKLVAERAVALAGGLDRAELILKDGRYGQQ